MIGRVGVFFDSKYIGKRLKKIRNELELSQSELSYKIGIAQHNLSRYENGQVDLPIHAMGALYILGYNLNWVICGKGHAKNDENESINNKDYIDRLEKEMKNLKNKNNRLEIENNELRNELIQRFKEIVEFQNQLLDNKKGE